MGKKNLYQYISKQSPQQAKILFNKFVDFVDSDLHKSNKPVNPDDIRHMYFDKPMKSIQTLGAFSKQNLTINGEQYVSALDILSKTYNLLEKKLTDTEYSFIHGDLTLSNVVFNRDKNSFI